MDSGPPIEPGDPELSTTRMQPGQTIIFLGDHTSPDHIGYVGVLGDVLRRFHPQLQLRLISAGSPGQNAAALGSDTLLNLLRSSGPDWLVIGVGLFEAMREPEVRRDAADIVTRSAALDKAAEEAFGPELRVGPPGRTIVQDSSVGAVHALQLRYVGRFEQELRAAVSAIVAVGIAPVLMTTVLVGEDLRHPYNIALKTYSGAIRRTAIEERVVLVDVERAARDIIERAQTYKQRVALASIDGTANAQGQALIVRTFMNTLGLLPGGRSHPLR